MLRPVAHTATRATKREMTPTKPPCDMLRYAVLKAQDHQTFLSYDYLARRLPQLLASHRVSRAYALQTFHMSSLSLAHCAFVIGTV